MEWVTTSGQMAPSTRVNGVTMKDLVLASINGQMAAVIKALGRMTCGLGRALILISMGSSSKDSGMIIISCLARFTFLESSIKIIV
jgi:hypothetical protein